MALLSNMSIERTIGQMSSSTGAGGYRYLGGDGITVDNDLYKISVDYNPETLSIDDQSRLTFNYSFLQAGDNVSINYTNGQLVISAAMFQSQFESGDKAKYDLACLNLAQAQLDIITINGSINTINGNIAAISGENGSISQLDGRIDTLESHDSDYGTRIGTLESHDTDHETRLGTAEATILAHTNTISANDQRSRANAQDIETIQGTIQTLTGYSGDIGDLASRMTAAEGSIGTNADNIAANLLLIQGNTNDISAINTAINTAETGYAARITSVENYANTNRELITALNTRVNTLDPGGAEPGESLADRMDAAEDEIESIDSTLESYQTNFDDISDRISVLSGDLTDLSNAVDSYETTTDGRLDMLESFQTSAEVDIGSLQQADSAIDGRLDVLEAYQTSSGGRLDDLEGYQTSSDNRISTLESYRTTDSGNISSLQGTVGNHTTTLTGYGSRISALESSVSNKEGSLSSTYYLKAPEATYTAVQNSDVFDPDYHYFFKDDPSYSQLYVSPTYVEASDSYDSSIDYYYYDAQNDQYVSYSYVDAETFATDITELNLIYFEIPSGTVLYESDGSNGYQLYSGSYDPTLVLYVQDDDTYTDRYVPEMTRVASGASYDSSITYFTVDLRGNLNGYTYTDSAGFDTAIASGLYYVSNWSSAISAGIYKQTFTSASSIFHVPTTYDGIVTLNTGTGNRLDISINGNMLSVTAAAEAETSITLAFCQHDNIEVYVTPVNNGNGVRGAIYARYFGSGLIEDPDNIPVVNPGSGEEPGDEEPPSEEP